MTAIVYCSVFSNIFDCNRYFWQSPDDCFAWSMKLRVAHKWPNNLTLALQFIYIYTHLGGWLDASWYALMWQRDAVSESIWAKYVGCVTARCGSSEHPQFDPCSPQSPVAQWLEHPTRSRRVVGSNPIWGSDFSESTFVLEFLLISIHWVS